MPCQPFSAAGQRKGTDDERHLWPYFAEAIRVLRPRYVFLENVAGHRSMGFGSVLGDLAAMRYDAQWCSVRASDVGAPHRRERLFVLATDTQRRDGQQSDGHTYFRGRSGNTEQAWMGNSGSDDSGRDQGSVDLLPTPRTTDRFGAGQHGEGGLDLRTAVVVSQWGKYGLAIRRWEALTRPAPPPTEPNTKGNPRLSARFSEWMMGWPAGWCTDPATGISRNDQLRIIGNGCVPQQVIIALTWLLKASEIAE